MAKQNNTVVDPQAPPSQKDAPNGVHVFNDAPKGDLTFEEVAAAQRPSGQLDYLKSIFVKDDEHVTRAVAIDNPAQGFRSARVGDNDKTGTQEEINTQVTADRVDDKPKMPWDKTETTPAPVTE